MFLFDEVYQLYGLIQVLYVALFWTFLRQVFRNLLDKHASHGKTTNTPSWQKKRRRGKPKTVRKMFTWIFNDDTCCKQIPKLSSSYCSHFLHFMGKRKNCCWFYPKIYFLKNSHIKFYMNIQKIICKSTQN